jgi:FMN reductase
MTDLTDLRVLLVDGSPTGDGRTAATLKAVGAAAAESGAQIELVSLGDGAAGGFDQALAALTGAEAFVLGSPVYRAASAAPLKHLIDLVPRGNDDNRDSVFAGRAVSIVYTGATLHHFLSLNGLRDVLAGFFAAHVVPPGLYVPRDGWGMDSELLAPYAEQAYRQGRALVELATLLRANSALRSLRPQA